MKFLIILIMIIGVSIAPTVLAGSWDDPDKIPDGKMINPVFQRCVDSGEHPSTCLQERKITIYIDKKNTEEETETKVEQNKKEDGVKKFYRIPTGSILCPDGRYVDLQIKCYLSDHIQIPEREEIVYKPQLKLEKEPYSKPNILPPKEVNSGGDASVKLQYLQKTEQAVERANSWYSWFCFWC